MTLHMPLFLMHMTRNIPQVFLGDTSAHMVLWARNIYFNTGIFKDRQQDMHDFSEFKR